MAPLVAIFGHALVLVGLLIVVWARVVLGANWSGRITFKEGHELIQYRYVRHPIYSGLLLMALGTAVVVNRTSAFLGVFVYFCVLWLKLRQEEALLTKHFPEAYRAYQGKTKALIPLIL